MEAERRGAAIQQQMHAHDPRVVEIYDFGDMDGYFFVAMEYVEGRSLAEVLQAEQAHRTVSRGGHCARNLRAACQAAFLANQRGWPTGRGARRYQAIEHPPRHE